MGLFTRQSPDQPRFKRVKEEGCIVTFSVEVPPQELEAEAHNELMRIQQHAHVPGFRPGKAPMEIIQKNYSGHAMEDVVSDLIRKYVPTALRELKIEPVAPPRIVEVDRKAGQFLKVSVVAETAPQVVVKPYTKIPVRRPSYPATDDSVRQRLDELRESHARLERDDAGTVGQGHYVVVDYTASQGGKPLRSMKGEGVLVDMSSDENVEGLSKGLEGQGRGETRQIPVKIGKKDAVLSVTVREIKKKILPPLDVDFAKDMGFAAMEELQAALKEAIEKEGKERSEREVMGQIEEALLKANQLPLPPSLVEAQVESMLERLRKQYLGPDKQWPAEEMEKLKTRLQPQAEKELRLSYILESIAEREKVAALDSDLQAELEKSLGSARTEEQKEEVRKLFEDRKETIASLIRERKTRLLLKERAAIADA
ncbi:MAG: trigger factor [Elusimicrobia bacterium]|nr:trigger factor [Elusimicrobiota bacterium]